MKRRHGLPPASAAFGLVVMALTLLSPVEFGPAAQGQPPVQLKLERTIPLPNVKGRIDHLAVDVPHQRLFVAELGNGSVDRIDLLSGETRRIGGLKEPQGLAYLADRNELVVASGGDGTVRFFDAGALAPVGSISLGDDADNVRVDPKTGQVVVGYGSGALAILDPARRTVVRTIALGAHPEGFQIDEGRKAFVNVPEAHKIVVVDLDSGRALANWRAAHVANFPMALGQDPGIVGIVYRIPARLVLIEAASGTAKADLPTCDDADDLYFDEKRRRVYVSCGSGAVDVFEQQAGGEYVASAHIETRPGARTSLFVPALDRLFVAARAGSGGQGAALLVYRPAP